MSNKFEYYPQLNSVRTFAVLLVLNAHFCGWVGFNPIPFAWYGVDVFFVLSGFLITGILLKSKPVYGKARLLTIRNFFIRRVLRLFPAYYLLIILFWSALHFGNLYIWNNNYNYYFFFYAPNWFFFFHPDQASGSFNHMWSLGVEEQFYLVWPWIILFLPMKFLKEILLFIILISLILTWLFVHHRHFGLMPFCNFHTLGMGGLFAYFYFERPKASFFKLIVRLREPLFLILFVFLVCDLLFLKDSFTKIILTDLLLASDGALMILCSVIGWNLWVSKIAGNKAIEYIGKISYGIYLYHMPVPDTIKAVAHHFGININYALHPYLWLSTFFCTTFIIAFFSYRFIEIPFLKLKSKFVAKPNLQFKSTTPISIPIKS